jgi:hypothetical protein
MSVVALWSPSDLLLSVLAPIGLAATRPSALVIDLDPRGPRYESPYTLADLVRDGAMKDQLDPLRGAVAVLPNGGVGIEDASRVVEALAERWPHVVLRCDPASQPPESAVSLLPLLPQQFMSRPTRRVVFQSLGFRAQAPKGALVLPRPGSATVNALMGLRTMPTKSSWLRQLAKIWSVA